MAAKGGALSFFPDENHGNRKRLDRHHPGDVNHESDGRGHPDDARHDPDAGNDSGTSISLYGNE